MTDIDEHHPAGRANDPTTTPVPVNDHCAELNPAQEDWPKETLENLRADARCWLVQRVPGDIRIRIFT